MSKEFEVGDKVSHPIFGNGKIVGFGGVGTTDNCPIKVQFKSGRVDCFTKLGRWSTSELEPSLYHGHGTFEIKFTPEPEPVYEWQWLVKDNEGNFAVTAFRKDESDIYEFYSSCKWSIHSRIEESKREVKP